MHTSGKFRPANPPVCFRTVGGNRRTRMKPMQIQAEHAKFHTRRTRAHEPWADDPCQMKSIWASSERFDGRYYIRLDGNLTFCTEELTSMNITSLLEFKSRNRAESWILTLLNVSFLCFLNLSYTRTRAHTHISIHICSIAKKANELSQRMNGGETGHVGEHMALNMWAALHEPDIHS